MTGSRRPAPRRVGTAAYGARRRGGAVPAAVLPDGAQRTVVPGGHHRAGLDVVPVHCTGRTSRSCSRLTDVPIARSLLNSAIVAVLQTAGPAGDRLPGRLRPGPDPVPASRYVFYAMLATLMIPAAVTFVPSFVVVSSLGWLSDFRGLVIPGLFSAFSVVPVPAVLPGLPARTRGSRPGRRARLRRGVSGGSSSRTRGLLRGDRGDHGDRQLERVPVAADHRAGPRRGRCRWRCRAC